MDRLQRLSDREEIEGLLSSYCEALDRMELERLRDIFTADCRVEFGADERLNATGSEALIAALGRLWRWRRTSHHLSNVRIVFSAPDKAQARSYVIAWHERRDGSTATLFGVYVDQAIRQAEGWRIAQRRQEMNGSDAGFSVGIFPAYRRPPPEDWRSPDFDQR